MARKDSTDRLSQLSKYARRRLRKRLIAAGFYDKHDHRLHADSYR